MGAGSGRERGADGGDVGRALPQQAPTSWAPASRHPHGVGRHHVGRAAVVEPGATPLGNAGVRLADDEGARRRRHRWRRLRPRCRRGCCRSWPPWPRRRLDQPGRRSRAGDGASIASCARPCRSSSSRRSASRSPTRAPSTAAVTSSRWLIVSIHSTSTPPSARPDAWAAKALAHSSIVIVAERFEQLAGRAHRAGDEHSSVGAVGGRPGGERSRWLTSSTRSSSPCNASRKAVPAEGVGEHDVGPGGDVVGVHRGDPIGLVEVPPLGRLADRQAAGEQLGAHRPVEDQVAPLGDQLAEDAHGANLCSRSPACVRASERQRANGQQRPAWPGNADSVRRAVGGGLQRSLTLSVRWPGSRS